MKGFTAGDSSDSDRDRHRMMMKLQARQRGCGRDTLLTQQQQRLPLPLLLLLSLLLLCLVIESTVGGKTTTIVRHTDTIDPQSDGFWTNRTTWNARWVKYWRAKRIYEPVWKKVWTPTIHTEWVPLPNAPEPDAWQKQDKNQLHAAAD